MSRPTTTGVAILAVLVALAIGPGIATATAGSFDADQNPFTTGCTVAVNATAGTPGNDLTFVIDGDDDGTITADEHLGTVSSNASTGEGSIAFAPRDYVSAGVSDVNLSVVEEGTDDGADDTGYPVTDIGATYDRNLSLAMDGTAPRITDYAVTNPTGTDVEISFNASEDLCTVTAVVTGTETGTLETTDFTGTRSGGGYVYNATFFPGGVGNYTATLTTAGDGSGNDGAANESASVIAGSAARNADEILHQPTTVYVGETGLDLSAVTTGERVSIVGVSGVAEGTVVEADSTALAVTAAAGFETGGYNLSGGRTTDIHVRRPAITDLALVLGDGEEDVAVTNGTVPFGRTVTASASYTFDAAEDLEVSVVGPDAVDVTPELAGTPLIPDSGEDLTLDFPATDLAAGTYTITVAGETLDVSRSATVRIASRTTTLSLSRTRVTRGKTVRATAFGDAGENVTIRIHDSDLADGYGPANASAVFGDTGDVESRSGVGGEYAAVELELGRDGIGTVLLRTDTLAVDRTARVEVVTEGIHVAGNGASVDAVPLQVAGRSVSIRDLPASVAVGEDLDITGTVPQGETVSAYALVDTAWVPLEGTGSGWAHADVGTDGEFTIEADAGAVVDRPDAYRVAVVADPDFAVEGVEDGGDGGTHADDVLTRGAMSEQVHADGKIRTIAAGLDARLSRRTIAATGEDAFAVNGQAPGTETVHVYRVGPRGETTGTAVQVDAGTFSHEIDGLDRRGRHRFLVVAPGRDGTFAGGPPTNTVSAASGTTPEAARAVLRDRYRGPGVDDVVVERSLRAGDPAVTIASVHATSGADRTRLAIAGTSNREAGHAIAVEAQVDGAAVASTATVVHEDGSTWNATIAVSTDTTSLRVIAGDGEAMTEQGVVLRSATTESPPPPTRTAVNDIRPASSPSRRSGPDRKPVEELRPTDPVSEATDSGAAPSRIDGQPREPGGLAAGSVAGAGTLLGVLAGWRWLLG